MNYHKLTESELDMLLLNAFYPKKKERINFSEIDNFRYMIVNLIKEYDLVEDFVLSLLKFADIDKDDFSITIDLFILINIDIKFLKMAALSAYHENKEHLK